MSSIAQLKKKWMEDPDVRDAFIEMTPEFEISRGLIAARIKAGLTQEEVALRMGTTQSVVARLEGGRSLPSMKSLYRYAEATGTKAVFNLVQKSL